MFSFRLKIGDGISRGGTALFVPLGTQAGALACRGGEGFKNVCAADLA